MDVIPCAPADQFKPVDNIRTRTFFIVQECLDEHALRTSLDCLIRTHWRKLGGRLVKRRKDGYLEYHVPRTFDPGYRLFHWSAQQYDHSIDKTAAAIRSPPLDQGLQFLPAFSVVDSWFRPADWPYHRCDDPPDSPLLYLHLSLFTDATVIATSIPHSVADQMGLANIINACLGLMRGRDPPPFVGYDGGDDLLPGHGKAYRDYPRRDLLRKGKHRIYRPGEYSLVLIPLIPDLILHREEQHLLFLPLPLIRALRDKWSTSLADEHDDFSRLSDGDVITAIIAKLSRLHKKTPRTLALSQTGNLRRQVPKLGPEQSAGFIHNALRVSTARFRMDPTTPARDMAYANRKAIERSLDPKEIELDMAVMREMVRIRQPSLICEPCERFYHVSNWCAAWRDVDFSPAVDKQKGRSGAETKPRFCVLGQSGERGVPTRMSALIMSKTEEGYWVQFTASVPAMKRIREYLSKDPTLQDF
ncbi:hypothetical protein E4U21_003257 [Claviceps maximensis]|nr:hypothetical protein E4U21_003257 [Claviceps maximensis]